MADTRLHRSVNGRVIGGVAGGLADFFGMDPTIVRLIFVLLAVFGGGGVLLYIILWIVLPERNNYNAFNTYTPPPSSAPPAGGSDSGIGETFEGFGKQNPDFKAGPDIATKRKFEGSLIGGVILILIGVFFLAERFIPQIRFGDFWPLLLVVVGLVLIFNSLPSRKKDGIENEAS
ncbi:MAG: PspC domain-containing protein [Bacteroidales bacterium]|nr:PspC domain-containing protein [Bacteroidales bacterium]MBK9356876.1 PspC domain-containing protein [Bacteroidales bacterium]